MEKINVHMTRAEYKALRSDLMYLYINEDNDEKAEVIFKIYKALNNWDFAEEVK